MITLPGDGNVDIVLPRNEGPPGPQGDPGPPGPASPGSTDVRSIEYYGGVGDGTTNNTTAFVAADASGRATYVPPGVFVVNALPTGKYYGEGRISVGGVETFLSSTPQVVNTADGYTPVSIGVKAGSNMTVNARANVALGYLSQQLNVNGDRNTATGYLSLARATSPFGCEAYGASAMSESTYGDRVTTVGSTAAKWSGCSDPVARAHDYFIADDPNRSARWPLGGADGGWRSVVGPLGGPSMIIAQSNDDNYQNVYVGRDSGDHAVVGTRNTVVGTHAFEGWAASYVTAIGWGALQYQLVDGFGTAVGAAALYSLHTGINNVAVGSYSATNLVHGYSNAFLGARSGYSLTGGSTLKVTAEANAYFNTFIGCQAGQEAITAIRTTLVGGNAASELTSVSDSAVVGYRALNGVLSVSHASVLGYRAADSIPNGLDNIVAIGFGSQVSASNTGKIGWSLTDQTLSGRAYSSQSYSTISNAAGVTYTTAQMLNGMIVRSGTTGPFSDTTPTASAIVSAIPGCEIGTTFTVWIANDGDDTLTIVAGSGVSLLRTTSIPSGYNRRYVGRVTNVTTPAVAVVGQEVSAASGSFNTLYLNGGTSLPLTTERTTSSYHVIMKRAGSELGGLQLNTATALLVGLGGNLPGLAIAATSSGAPTTLWVADTGTFRPILDNADDLGLITRRVRKAFVSTIVTGVRVVTAAGAVTVTDTDSIVVINKTIGAATAVNLNSSPVLGQQVRIKDGKGDAATNNITISPASGTIDGAASSVINTNYGAKMLVYNGTEWSVI